MCGCKRSKICVSATCNYQSETAWVLIHAEKREKKPDSEEQSSFIWCTPEKGITCRDTTEYIVNVYTEVTHEIRGVTNTHARSRSTFSDFYLAHLADDAISYMGIRCGTTYAASLGLDRVEHAGVGKGRRLGASGQSQADVLADISVRCNEGKVPNSNTNKILHTPRTQIFIYIHTHLIRRQVVYETKAH